jgi:beta-phosphoglucomutase-like phosphatase (HAD superfamily)
MLSANPNRLIIFDIEGTLVDCITETIECWREILNAFGHGVPDEEARSGP